ncbi:cytochrome C [Hanamia caeni]|jgi:mono/diheme cytochrome c family protein|uniref:Cytochrome C n=1 Tax=Hanamia caeni TaxID=2294116 RepID=A0A3M9N840_9BACT|nr:c-type cytochrome [Hanamia caeni]RNI33383.1 cytochrome C [Hanamia caeni]
MKEVKRLFTKTFAVFIFLTLISSPDFLYAQSSNGEALFKANCASCHKPDKQYVGPALKGAREREPSKGWHYEWIRNASSMAMTDPYAKKLKDQMGGVVMTSFPDLSNADIDAILDYADNFKEPGSEPSTGAPGAVSSVKTTGSSSNTVLYGLLTLILAVVGLVLLQVNSNLKKLTDEKDGLKSPPNVPFYRNKTYLLLLTIVLFLVAGYFLVDGAMGLGRQQGYQPDQPVYFVHQVHAGVNQISCLYCHGGAQDSKHATIPAVNVCMNCHMSVKEYTGAPIIRDDGTTVDANGEIQKLYKYAGWNPDTKKYDKPGKPIEWVQIHNLPDFVYFNHSQHVKVGQIACQTCHGEIQNMVQVKQFTDLSMGWCVNCHRTTNVQFDDNKGNGNKFYSIYQKFHQDIKDKKYDSVTVQMIGGTECGKCHY